MENKKRRKVKSSCEECGVITKTKKLSFYKGRLLCKPCILKKPQNILQLEVNCIKRGSESGRKTINLEQALKKVYDVNFRMWKTGYTCYISVPKCFINRKVRLKIVG